MRARNDILNGEELVDSYVDSMESLYARRSQLEKHGFVCTCDLCGLVRSFFPLHYFRSYSEQNPCDRRMRKTAQNDWNEERSW